MGRRAVNVDLKLIQLLIDEHEANWETGFITFMNHITDLYNNSTTMDKMSIGTLQLRITQGKIKCNVKRARRVGDIITPETRAKIVVARRNRKKSFDPAGLQELLKRKGVPDWGKGLIRRAIKNPKLRNLINVKCAECAGFSSTAEIKYCNINSCPLHSVRPFQKSAPNKQEETND